MKTRNELRAKIKEVIRPNGIGAITAAAHQELLLELVDILGAEIDEVEAVTDVVSDGNYPAMTVGYADNLVGRGEATPEMFSFRASGGRSINDGTARIKVLHGNAVVLNQHLPNNGNWRVQDGTLTMENNAYVVTPTGGYPGIATSLQSAIPVGNKIAVVYDYYIQGASDAYVNIGGNNSRITNVEQGAWRTIVHIIPCEKWNEAVGCVVFGGGAASVIKLKDIRCYDLTRMFGQGNEPTTADAFNAMLPLNVDLNAYNDGEVIPFNGTAVKAIGDNAWDEEWRSGYYYGNGLFAEADTHVANVNPIRVIPNAEYRMNKYPAFVWYYDKDMQYISSEYVGSAMRFIAPSNAHYVNFSMEPAYGTTYKNDICISLYHSGYKEGQYFPYKYNIRNIDNRILELFPNGMHKWDKAYNNNGKGYVVKGTGVVDLGSLNWSLFEPYGFYATAPNNMVVGNLNYLTNLSYSKFADPDRITWSNSDKAITNGLSSIGTSWVRNICVKDSAYTDAASFKAAMQGVMLYYELAEPQVYEFAEPFNLDYEVADFGTEEILSDTPSAPLSADIIYQFNAVDSIRDLLTRVASLEAKL